MSPRLAVLLFPHPGERRAGGFLFPAGSRTYGFFWSRRHYLLYVLHGPDGGLIAHRFDVVDEVRLRPGRVEYLDLALDVWANPSGRAWTEDEDEVIELASQRPSLAAAAGAHRDARSGFSWRGTVASPPRRGRSYGTWVRYMAMWVNCYIRAFPELDHIEDWFFC